MIILTLDFWKLTYWFKTSTSASFDVYLLFFANILFSFFLTSFFNLFSNSFNYSFFLPIFFVLDFTPNSRYLFVAFFLLIVTSLLTSNLVPLLSKVFDFGTWADDFFFSQVYNLHFCPIDIGGQPVQSNIVSMAYCFKNNMSHYPHNPNKIVFQWDVEVNHHKMLLNW